MIRMAFPRRNPCPGTIGLMQDWKYSDGIMNLMVTNSVSEQVDGEMVARRGAVVNNCDARWRRCTMIRDDLIGAFYMFPLSSRTRDEKTTKNNKKQKTQ